MADIYNSLRNATYAFFPKDGSWTSDKYAKGEDSLQAHLRDTEWLTKALKKYLEDIDEDTIRVFVSSSEFFKEQRSNYEQRIVKWQIEWMTSGGDNYLVREEYGGDFLNFDTLCDIGFRQAILDTLLAIGMDEEAIEEGIERNANLWRETYMKRAFRNKYEPIELLSRDKELEPTVEGHLELWLKLRRHQYYQVHKASVDKYGNAKNTMELSEEDAKKIAHELALLDQSRMQYIKLFQETTKFKAFSLQNIIPEEEINNLNKIPEEEPSQQVLEETIKQSEDSYKKGIKTLIKRFFYKK